MGALGRAWWQGWTFGNFGFCAAAAVTRAAQSCGSTTESCLSPIPTEFRVPYSYKTHAAYTYSTCYSHSPPTLSAVELAGRSRSLRRACMHCSPLISFYSAAASENRQSLYRNPCSHARPRPSDRCVSSPSSRGLGSAHPDRLRAAKRGQGLSPARWPHAAMQATRLHARTGLRARAGQLSFAVP